MQINGDQVVNQLVVGQQTIYNVDRFTYIGCILTSDGNAEAHVSCRYNASILSVSHDSETWKSTTVQGFTRN